MVRRGQSRKPWQGHERVLIDTCVWVYHIEGHEQFGPAAAEVLAALEEGAYQGIVCELSLMELLVRPLQLRQQAIADEYELLLTSFPNLVLAPVTREVLTGAAALRARHGLRTPDAIVMSCGIRNGASLAFTNDRQWQRVSDMSVQCLADFPLAPSRRPAS